VKRFVEEGANVDAVDSYGKNPFVLATVWGHQEVARYLAHQMWFKQKKDENKAKQAYTKYTERLQKDFAEQEEILRAEKQKESEICYKEWHSKNNFIYNPFLYGHISYERTVPQRAPHHTPSNLQSNKAKEKSISASEPRTKYQSKSNAAIVIKTNDRTVKFLPLSDLYKA